MEKLSRFYNFKGIFITSIVNICIKAEVTGFPAEGRKQLLPRHRILPDTASSVWEMADPAPC